MKNLLCAFLLFSSITLQSQSPPFIFNQVFQSDSNGISSVAVKPHISGGYWVLGGFNWYGGYSAFYIRDINVMGSSNMVHIIDEGYYFSTIYFGGSLQQTLNGNYIVAGDKGNNVKESDFYLVSIANGGNVLWSKQFLYEGSDQAAQVIVANDNGYLLFGFNQIYYPNGTYEPTRIFLIKTDMSGNELWHQYISTNVIPLYAEQTLDGGFLISGYQYNDATGYDMYVVKTDATGTVEWERTYGTPANDGGSMAMQRPDGLVILIGVIKGEVTTGKLYYAILNPANGDVLYSITHQKYDKYSPGSSPLLLSDDRLALATLSYGPPPTWEVAFTIFDNAGNIIQETPISSGLPGEDYIRDLEPTPDGGFILAGFNYTVPQSSWVVKLGPNGEYCGTAPCVDSLMTNTISTPPHIEVAQNNPTTLFPNPAKGSTTITYTLPAQLPFAVVEFYDLQGQKVLYQVLPAGGSPLNQLPLNPLKGSCTQTVDLSGLAAGVYIWRLALPGGYEQYEASGKLVVEQ